MIQIYCMYRVVHIVSGKVHVYVYTTVHSISVFCEMVYVQDNCISGKGVMYTCQGNSHRKNDTWEVHMTYNVY